MKYVDQMGREVEICEAPQRIVSLVPSITELLFDLGLSSRVVGVTKFCTRPEEARKIKKVGGTKSFDFDGISELKPDLILCNKEENYKEGVLQLAEAYPVWVSVVDSLGDCVEMVRSIGKITRCSTKAENLANSIQVGFDKLEVNFGKSALYVIWRKPYMAAASGTFINNILERCGFTNIFEDQEQYPKFDSKDLETHPDVILLSSEPYPFSEKHIDEFRNHFPKSDVLLVDGEMFSWFGSRMNKAPNYFSKLYQVYCANSTKRD